MTGKEYIIPIDQGTTSSRVLAFSHSGDILGLAQKEIEQHYPQNGWVEHDAEEIWIKTIECLLEVVEAQKEQGRTATAVGITNQRETSLIWERKSGKPLSRAIVWQDRRTADYCDSLKAGGHEAMITEKTGLVVDSYFSASKFRWLLNEAGIEFVQGSVDFDEDSIVATSPKNFVYQATLGKYEANLVI